jgi:hypothetical protein
LHWSCCNAYLQLFHLGSTVNEDVLQANGGFEHVIRHFVLSCIDSSPLYYNSDIVRLRHGRQDNFDPAIPYEIKKDFLVDEDDESLDSQTSVKINTGGGAMDINTELIIPDEEKVDAEADLEDAASELSSAEASPLARAPSIQSDFVDGGGPTEQDLPVDIVAAEPPDVIQTGSGSADFTETNPHDQPKLEIPAPSGAELEIVEELDASENLPG